MLNYLSRRMLYAIVALLVVVTVTFIFMHAIPGGPFQREKALPEAVKKNIEARYKLDQPLYIQYIDYLSHLVKGDLGPSYKYRGLTVNDIIEERFPVSVQLGSVAILIALLLGIPAGILAALHQNSIPDYVVMFFSTIGIAMPSFVIGTVNVSFGVGAASPAVSASAYNHAGYCPGRDADGVYRPADPLQYARGIKSGLYENSRGQGAAPAAHPLGARY